MLLRTNLHLQRFDSVTPTTKGFAISSEPPTIHLRGSRERDFWASWAFDCAGDVTADNSRPRRSKGRIQVALLVSPQPVRRLFSANTESRERREDGPGLADSVHRMSRAKSLLLRALEWPWKASILAPPEQPARSREAVLCIGCDQDTGILDKVLGPGSYDLSFMPSIDGAYVRIAASLPDRVILCMRADDEASLQVLSMLTIDARTRGIPVITCVPEVAVGDDRLTHDGRNGSAAATPFVLMH